MSSKFVLDAEVFIASLRSELALYKQIADFSKQEQQILQEADPAKKLLPLLGKKTRLLDEIAQIEAIITPMKNTWKNNNSISSVDKEVITELLEEIGTVLQGLISNELSSEKIMNGKYASTTPVVNNLNKGAGALAQAAYMKNYGR